MVSPRSCLQKQGWHFIVLPTMKSVGASVHGGVVLLSTGMLTQCLQSEKPIEALMFLIAHEQGHIVLQHVVSWEEFCLGF